MDVSPVVNSRFKRRNRGNANAAVPDATSTVVLWTFGQRSTTARGCTRTRRGSSRSKSSNRESSLNEIVRVAARRLNRAYALARLGSSSYTNSLGMGSDGSRDCDTHRLRQCGPARRQDTRKAVVVE